VGGCCAEAAANEWFRPRLPQKKKAPASRGSVRRIRVSVPSRYWRSVTAETPVDAQRDHIHILADPAVEDTGNTRIDRRERIIGIAHEQEARRLSPAGFPFGFGGRTELLILLFMFALLDEGSGACPPRKRILRAGGWQGFWIARNESGSRLICNRRGFEMPNHEREIYHSENGDRWLLCRADDGRIFVLHKANVSSGGKVT
jgi:hypothetical protein